METILITGANGFVGSNLKKYFEQSYNILSPRSFELDCTDNLSVKKFFSENQIDYIIHCATKGGARGVKDADTTLTDNMAMVENLLEYRNDAKFILFSSGAMYGKQRSLDRINEDEIGDITPQDLYGKSKMTIAQKIKDIKNTICLTIFACYGYNELPTRFPSYAIGQNIAQKPITINKNVIFDYLFIEDLNKIVEHFIKNDIKKYNLINVTPNKSSELLEIAQIINEISNFKSEIIIKEEDLNQKYTGNNSRLLYEIPQIRFTPLKEGLSKLYKFIVNTDKYSN